MISSEEFARIKNHAAEMESIDQRRNTLYEQLEDIYMLKSADLPQAEWIKETLSPDGRNAVNGAVRLLIGADPVWSVPRETNPASLRKQSDKLERAARMIWDQAGQTKNRPVHYDVAFSGVMYSEIHILLESTKAIAELQKPGSGSKAHAERTASRAPVLFTVVNPRDGHAQWGAMGLEAYYSRRQLSLTDVRSRFGELVKSSRKETDLLEVHDYWSRDWHVVWSPDQEEPYIQEENKDGCIPVVAVICEGTTLLNRDEQDKTQGFLYTTLKSNLWQRKNLYLTVMNSLIFAVGANPILVYESEDEAGELNIDYSQPGGVIRIKPNEKLSPLLQRVIDPQMVEQMRIIDQLHEESTMYKTATGQSIGGNAPFSLVSLLAQAGRLPLVVYQRMVSMAITLAMQEAFRIIKRDGGKVKASGKTGLQEIKASEIPDEFDLRASLEISLPQDDRLNVQIAVEGIKAGLFSKRYARETYAHIGQSQDMDDEILEEKFADMQGMAELQKAMQELQAQMQPQTPQIPGGPGGQQPGMMPPQGMPPGMEAPPPEMGDAGMQGGNGLPMGEPMEPMGSPFGPGGEEPVPPEGGGY